MRAALVHNEQVLNVIEYDPTEEYIPEDGVELVELTNEIVGPGWSIRNDEFIAPPSKSLEVYPEEIPSDDTTAATAVYKNTHDDAPSEVVFEVNGTSASVSLVNGLAELEITTAQPGAILIRCDGMEARVEGLVV